MWNVALKTTKQAITYQEKNYVLISVEMMFLAHQGYFPSIPSSIRLNSLVPVSRYNMQDVEFSLESILNVYSNVQLNLKYANSYANISYKQTNKREYNCSE